MPPIDRPGGKGGRVRTRVGRGTLSAVVSVLSSASHAMGRKRMRMGWLKALNPILTGVGWAVNP
eukprot:scaffold18034_cov157-Isochrysis_galbana.AAC.1